MSLILFRLIREKTSLMAASQTQTDKSAMPQCVDRSRKGKGTSAQVRNSFMQQKYLMPL